MKLLTYVIIFTAIVAIFVFGLLIGQFFDAIIMDEINKTLLMSSLEVAVPLWIETFKDYDWDEFKRVMNNSEDILSECAEAVLYRVEGKSAQAFNALARAIAVLSYVPGGIEIFGMRFKSSNEPT